jgi:lipopolysaccharide transport system permease protein
VSMARRELAARYRGSMGDVAWTILHPLLLMLTYFFVFGIVLKARLGGDDSRSGFVLYFLAGMLPWLPFSEAVGRSPSVIPEHRNFVKKLLFPVETLPVSQTVAALVTEGFALLIFLALLVAVRGAVPLTIGWLPALIVPQVLLTLGVCWFLAALGVYLRDLGQIIGFLLTLLMFLTPIFYPRESLPPWSLVVLNKSPIFVLVEGYRAALLDGRSPALVPLAGLWAVSLAVFFTGFAWFHRLRRSFADVI